MAPKAKIDKINGILKSYIIGKASWIRKKENMTKRVTSQNVYLRENMTASGAAHIARIMNGSGRASQNKPIIKQQIRVVI
ncbi:hypothetical protein VSA01S_15190 [Vibrio sagamiensis NBRC 104589]|uniref:Uncharacterized protein n=1 Tax=Vibrio sagamiensis NBRC 104589 TaxID=1219064 RepID=A0A511QE10_9VIBR|nr:hypothetical protein VSA01S_15190 [Vibrio sagamiensis NBRC 104589]